MAAMQKTQHKKNESIITGIPQKIVIASDSFKGSASSIEVGRAISKGIQKAFKAETREHCEIIQIPVADGGEGSVEALVAGQGGEMITVAVTGPLGGAVDAQYGLLKDGTAVIEMAAASGLPLVPPDKRDPKITTTRGTGELILEALNRGSRNIVLGIGGSATNDGGTGMAAALGYKFLDKEGHVLGSGGGHLGQLYSIDSSKRDKRLAETTVSVACDVNNPLTGPKGASAVYGPQKGANQDDVELLDNNLEQLAQVVAAAGVSPFGNNTNRGQKPETLPGAGAAGGLGYGLMVFCNADLRSGIEIVLDTLRFDEIIASADLIITGEGLIDGQSIYGKVPVGIAKRGGLQGIPVVALVGGIGKGACEVYNHNINGLMSIIPLPMSLEEAMENALTLIEDGAERMMRLIMVGVMLNT